MTFTEEALEKLKAVSTATLTTVLLKRGLRNVFIRGVHKINPDAPRLVGPAFTLRYIPAREDIDTIGVFADRAHPQRRAIEECPPGHVLVMDSRKDPSAASAGGILVTRLHMRGVAGVVTDGGFRDTPDIAKLPFAAYHSAPSAPTNLIRHHALDINQPIGCGDVPVYPGDIIVGDDEGVVVIPADMAQEIADEAFEQTVFEDFVEDRVKAGRGIFGLYPPGPEAEAEFRDWRREKGR
ncbi:regulator of RNase E activity RraA [Neorhizobium sp. R1-B]|jgi:regulator of RNase E activity RraA|uniref:ribonuclease activity regulator RraA n=1 Tax=Neorhizobium TaxID=1525371 RepID=UPI000CF95E67|nr:MULTISPECIES: ribonuclease activity regulator RraA [Neorhizobium]TCV59707.1 regulator of RNase E activity RraA [Neorhizobium sp. S3-V5DH]TDX68743.1 regulator of RNase E activity RraA [Neorhizobium sp. R1-B]